MESTGAPDTGSPVFPGLGTLADSCEVSASTALTSSGPVGAALPRLLQSLMPPGVVQWLRSEIARVPCVSGLDGDGVSHSRQQGGLSGDGEKALNPAFPLESAVTAQLARLGGEAWEALRGGGLSSQDLEGAPEVVEEPVEDVEAGADGVGVGAANWEGPQLSVGESCALLEVLLPLAAQRVCDGVAGRDLEKQETHSFSGSREANSPPPQTPLGPSEGLQQWHSLPSKGASSLSYSGNLLCPLLGPLLGPLQQGEAGGVSGGLSGSGEDQRRRMRKRRQILLRQLLKSRAVLLQLSSQAEAGLTAASGGIGEPQHRQQDQPQERELLQQRIRVELRRAALAAYNLNRCCRRVPPLLLAAEEVEAHGASVGASRKASQPLEAAAHSKGELSSSALSHVHSEGGTQQRQQQKAALLSSEDAFLSHPEWLLPLAALPGGVAAAPPDVVDEGEDLEESSPPAPPPSPLAWSDVASPAEGPLDAEGAPRRGTLFNAAGNQEGGGPWILQELAFDGRRSAFVVTLSERPTELPSSSSPSRSNPSQSTKCVSRRKIFYCLCRSRDRAAAVVARYAELKQCASLSPDETEAASLLSDEGETDGERDATPRGASTQGKKGCSNSKGTMRLLQEAAEGLQLLLLRQQRVALQQQGGKLFAAASQGCWFAADTIIRGAPFPLSDPPWRHRLAPVPPGVRLSAEGTQDAADEAPTPRAFASAILPPVARGAPNRPKGPPKYGGPFPSGGPLNSYGAAADEEDSGSLAGMKKCSTSPASPVPAPQAAPAPAAAAATAEAEAAGFPYREAGEGEDSPFTGDPPNAKPWPRPPVCRSPYMCFSVEAPIGELPMQVHGIPDKATSDSASAAEGPWMDFPADGSAGKACLASTRDDALAEGVGSTSGGKSGETTTGPPRVTGAPGSAVSWAIRVTQRQKGDSWQLRMAAALMTRGFDDLIEEPRRDSEAAPVDYLLLYDSPQNRDAALKALQGLTPPVPTSFGVAADSERRKELRQLYDLFVEPTFAVQSDDKVVRVRDAVVNIFTYPQLYIMWFACPAGSEAINYLLNLAHTFCDRLGAAATETGARELPADDAVLLQKNRLLLQLYMAQDQRDMATNPSAAACQSTASQDSAMGVAGLMPVAEAPAAGSGNVSASAGGTGGGGGGGSRPVGSSLSGTAPLEPSPVGTSAPGSPPAAAITGYREEVLQVAGVGPVDFTLPDGVKFDKSKLAFRCLWREGKYGLYQSKLLAMQARLASELLIPQPPATSRYRIPALAAVVFGLLPLPEPVESPQQAVEGLPVPPADRQSRRLKWQHLLQQGGWRGGCPDLSFAEAAADAVEALVGDTQAAALRSSRSEDGALLPPMPVDPSSGGGWGAPAGLCGLGAPQGPLDSPAAWVVQPGDGGDGRVLQQQSLSSRSLLACVWEHAAYRWRVALAAPTEEALRGPEAGTALGRTCFFFSPSDPAKKKQALLLARRWAACQLLLGERLCVLAGPLPGTETSLEFLQSCPGLWTAEDEADVGNLALMRLQQLQSIAASCESEGAAGFAAAAPETGVNANTTSPSNGFDCSQSLGAPPPRMTSEAGAPLHLSGDAVGPGGPWGDWHASQNPVGGPPFGQVEAPWGPLTDSGGSGEWGGPAKRPKPRARPPRQGAPVDEADAERVRSQKAAAARVRWMRYRMQQEAGAQQLSAALAATMTDSRPPLASNGLSPIPAVFPM
ncbi:hypothetical protein cyc_00962 [Cyclospora cayetanensis]|uniref:Uncharacterized protein n=1 Tax=Cyclospora cayetanensis TaxID=88456 RepID=A0A1D3D941_9EIME|nr:hypothetical protein cyc_00962 [Cyclospora cayetanensis]